MNYCPNCGCDLKEFNRLEKEVQEPEKKMPSFVLDHLKKASRSHTPEVRSLNA